MLDGGEGEAEDEDEYDDDAREPKEKRKRKKRNTRKYTFDLRKRRQGNREGDEKEMDETRLDVRR